MAENNQGVINALKESNKAAAGVIKEELKDQFKPFADQITAPLNQMKAGINSLPGVSITKKLFSAVSKPLKDSFNADKNTSAKEVEANNAATRDAEANQTLMEDIRDGILGIQDGLIKGLANLKDKGLMGLGILAGLVAAPFVALTSFFTQLGKELAMLKKAGEFIFLKPFNAIKSFFTNLGTKFTNSKAVTYFDDVVKSVKTFFTTVGTNIKNSKVVGYFDDALKGVKTFFSTLSTNIGNSKVVGYFDDVVLKTKGYFSTVSTSISNMKVGAISIVDDIALKMSSVGQSITKFLQPVKNLIMGSGGGPAGAGGSKGIVGFVKGLFSPIRTVIDGVKSSSALVQPFMAGFQPVINFAKTVGTVLGKFFLPITILMGVYDSITGFMSGYSDTEGNTGEKIFAGVKEGLAKVVTNLIGLPLDLLKKGLTYLITFFFGESVVTKSLEAFSFADTIGKMVRLPFDMIKKAYEWVKTLFVDPKTALVKLWNGLVGEGGLIDLLFTPIDKALKWVMGVFGFSIPLDKDGKEYSIMGIIKNALFGIVDFFKSLLDIDVKGVLKSIPGGGFLLSLFEDDTVDEKIADAQAKIKSIQADVDSDGFFETEGNKEKNLQQLAEAQKELEELKAQKQQQTVINNYNNVDNSTKTSSQTLTSLPITDQAAMSGAGLD